MDSFTKQQRSACMARIRSTNTQPELTVRRALHAAGYRFRLHRRDLPGKPDIVLPRHRLAIFVHGCFWHGHTCKDGRRPRSNEGYWNPKLDRNLARDARRRQELSELGWKAVTVWACTVKDVDEALRTVQEALVS